MMEYTIQQLSPDDRAQILSIYQEGLDRGDVLLDADDPAAWVDFEGKSGIVAKHDENVIGWAAVALLAGEDLPEGIARLSVFVKPEYRNQGIGRILMNTVLAISEQAGVNMLVSGIVAKNIPALMLHKTSGFRAMGMLRQAGLVGEDLTDAVLLQYTWA